MIDIKLLRDDPDLVRASQRARGEDEGVVDASAAADERRRSSLTAYERLRAEQKSIGKEVATAQGDEKQALLARTKEISAQVKDAPGRPPTRRRPARRAAAHLGNVVEPGVPAGGEDDYVVVETGRRRPRLRCRGLRAARPPRAGRGAWARSTWSAARRCPAPGSTSCTASAPGCRWALLNLAMSTADRRRVRPDDHRRCWSSRRRWRAPDSSAPTPTRSTGWRPTTSTWSAPRRCRWPAYHSDEILDLSAGPLRYAGWSSCFRREAGSYGKDTRGIIRVHQFDKVEMFVFCRPEEAAARARRLLGVRGGDAGQDGDPLPGDRRRRRRPRLARRPASSTARRGCPPSRPYRELTSTSNCTTFQARRLGVRYRDEDGKPQVAATLNGTLATTRWLVAILENHQQADGSVGCRRRCGRTSASTCSPRLTCGFVPGHPPPPCQVRHTVLDRNLWGCSASALVEMSAPARTPETTRPIDRDSSANDARADALPAPPRSGPLVDPGLRRVPRRRDGSLPRLPPRRGGRRRRCGRGQRGVHRRRQGLYRVPPPRPHLRGHGAHHELASSRPADPPAAVITTDGVVTPDPVAERAMRSSESVDGAITVRARGPIRLDLKRALIASLAVFVVAFAVITGIELTTGDAFDGNSGTTISQLRGSTSTDQAPTPSSTPSGTTTRPRPRRHPSRAPRAGRPPRPPRRGTVPRPGRDPRRARLCADGLTERRGDGLGRHADPVIIRWVEAAPSPG